MRRWIGHPEFARRAFTSCLVGLYALMGLLGSGGLHALMPHSCCVHSHGTDQETVRHRHSCGHVHHHHASTDEQQAPADSTPATPPCDSENCLICKHSLIPAVIAPAVEPVLSEAPIRTHCGRAPPCPQLAVAPRILIRGPPSA